MVTVIRCRLMAMAYTLIAAFSSATLSCDASGLESRSLPPDMKPTQYLGDYGHRVDAGGLGFSPELHYDAENRFYVTIVAGTDDFEDRSYLDNFQCLLLRSIHVSVEHDRSFDVLSPPGRLYPLVLMKMPTFGQTPQVMVGEDIDTALAEARRLADTFVVSHEGISPLPPGEFRACSHVIWDRPFELPLISDQRVKVTMEGAVITTRGEEEFSLTFDFISRNPNQGTGSR